MQARIKSLAQLMRDKKKSGETFVLMLGAGASISSGVKPTPVIMQEVVDKYGKDLQAPTIEERFDALWRRSPPNDRRLFLESYFDCQPSKGYDGLAQLIKLGYFERILTFNFDNLLEKSLQAAGFTQFKSMIRGETKDEAFAKLIENPEPTVKIIKLHGSLYAADDFLFSKEEMLNYPSEVHRIVHSLTSEDIIICGYAFNDVCVVRSFNDSRTSGSIYCINPAGAPDNIKGFLLARRSHDRLISGESGRFDDFFVTLHESLTSVRQAHKLRQPRNNPFKFLDYYHETDKNWFAGREELLKAILDKIESNDFRAFHICGPPCVGKTSFIHAGVRAHLDPNRFFTLSLRCETDVEGQLRRHLAAFMGQPLDGRELKKIFDDLYKLTGKHTILFLDQCEKAFQSPSTNGAGHPRFMDFMSKLFQAAHTHTTLVFVVLDHTAYLKGILNLKVDPIKFGELVEIVPLSPEKLRQIIEDAATRGGIQFDSRILEDLCERYKRSLAGDTPRGNFSLSHVQAVCYYLAKSLTTDWDEYQQLLNPNGLLAFLNSLINESNFMNMINDLPSADKRMVIRAIMKIICAPGNNSIGRILEFIKNHFPELLSAEQFPEPIPAGDTDS
jgi:Novel STAND NTPase 1/SIR2-like domain